MFGKHQTLSTRNGKYSANIKCSIDNAFVEPPKSLNDTLRNGGCFRIATQINCYECIALSL